MTAPAKPEFGLPDVDVTTAADDDLMLFSVTTVIDALEKGGLIYWAAERTAEAAIDNLATWKAMLEDRGRAEAVKWLRDARFRPTGQLSDADLGSAVHKVCETYALTGVKPTRDFAEDLVVRAAGQHRVDIDAEVRLVGIMLNHFDRWCQRFQPSYQATEVTVFNRTYGYAGQADAFLTIDGVRFLTDYKTSRKPFDGKGQPRKPYPEQNALQLAAYRKAEFAAVWRPRRFESYRRRYYLLGADERAMAVPVPEVDTGLVLKITPEACMAYPMRCDDEVFQSFLYVAEVWRWVNEISKTVMGEPLEEPTV